MGEMNMEAIKRRTFEIIQIGKDQDTLSITFDFFIAVVILVNLFVTLMETFDMAAPFMGLLTTVDWITMVIFGIEYGLRVWTAEYLYPKKSPLRAKLAFMGSFYGVIDMLTFLPYFLPIFFPMGIVAFRMFRVARIFRLFRINTYYDAFNVITDILREKRDQIFSSVCIILILMIASSLCMYSLEHDVQPDKFQNAFSGIWWSMSTLLTVGYGDIYPITSAGRIVGIFIAFLGVGTVAIPTGIISAGFVEQYTKLKTLSTYTEESDIRFITLKIQEGNPWENLPVEAISLPPGLILAVISRNNQTIVPRGDTVLQAGDKLVLGAEGYKDEIGIKLKEFVLHERHPWIGTAIKDLDISRQTLIVMVRRGGRIIIPNGSLVLEAEDMVILYTKRDIRDSVEISL
ncbi:MAG: ion transporter [Lachnospiraceae bacterium]|nr:ion transporter [Lachnospiraceae bacterium]